MISKERNEKRYEYRVFKGRLPGTWFIGKEKNIIKSAWLGLKKKKELQIITIGPFFDIKDAEAYVSLDKGVYASKQTKTEILAIQKYVKESRLFQNSKPINW